MMADKLTCITFPPAVVVTAAPSVAPVAAVDEG